MKKKKNKVVHLTETDYQNYVASLCGKRVTKVIIDGKTENMIYSDE